jgi:hypothetical protein
VEQATCGTAVSSPELINDDSAALGLLLFHGLQAIPFMFVIKLTLVFCRWLAATVCSGGLLFAFQLLLQGVAQLDVEGLAKQPETAEEVQRRMEIVFTLLSLGIGGSLVFQAAGVFSEPWRGMFLSRVRKVLFVVLVFWAGVCLFLCLLVIAGSFQARWDVPGIYYWLAGGAGVMMLVLLGAANFFADGKQGERAEA